MPVFDQKRVEKLKQILKWHPRGITISDLAVKMEMNRNLVAKYLDILLISGQVEMQEIGAAKVYFLSNLSHRCLNSLLICLSFLIVH
jgi:predicted transcriptional regulator